MQTCTHELGSGWCSLGPRQHCQSRSCRGHDADANLQHRAHCCVLSNASTVVVLNLMTAWSQHGVHSGVCLLCRRQLLSSRCVRADLSFTWRLQERDGTAYSTRPTIAPVCSWDCPCLPHNQCIRQHGGSKLQAINLPRTRGHLAANFCMYALCQAVRSPVTMLFVCCRSHWIPRTPTAPPCPSSPTRTGDARPLSRPPLWSARPRRRQRR